MSTLFTKIVNDEIPSHRIAENENCYAFLDISPVVMGHTLVIPKVEIDYIFNLDDELLAELMIFARRVAKAIEKTIPCKRIGVAVIGLEVPHTHIHLVPMQSEADLSFSRPRLTLSADEMTAVAQKIRENYSSTK